MSIKSFVIASALGASTLLGIGAASADPYRGETPRAERIEHRIHRADVREARHERRFDRREVRRDRRLNRVEHRQAERGRR